MGLAIRRGLQVKLGATSGATSISTMSHCAASVAVTLRDDDLRNLGAHVQLVDRAQCNCKSGYSKGENFRHGALPQWPRRQFDAVGAL